jgi:quinol monooxygenase YgiN
MLLPKKKYREALKILRSIAEQSRVLPGCISSRLLGDLEEKNVVLIEAMWRDQESLESYLRSEEYRNLLLVAELSLECPEIKFDIIAGSTGIETVEKARGNL